MAKKIKILHIGMSPNYGGIESYIINCYRNIDKNKFSFDFVNTSKYPLAFENELISYGSKIYRIPGGFVNYLNMKRELNKIINLENYDYVQFHLLNYCGFFPILVALHNKKTRVILHSHTSGYSGNAAIKEIFLHNIGKLLIGNKKVLRLACSINAGKWLYNDKDFTIMRNGIDHKKFIYNSSSRKTIRKKYGIRQSDILIGNVTNYSYPKNNGYLLDLFRNLHKINKNYKLILVGDDKNAHQERNFIADNNLTDSVVFTGLVNNMDDIYSAMDLYICPSIIEGFNISIMEAAANGLSCFISNHIRKTQYPGTNKFYEINIDINADNTAKYINEIYINSKNRRSKHDFIDTYDIKSCARELGSFYENAQDNRRSIVAFDPACGTQNLGDHIITNSIENEMKPLFDDYYLIHYSTHNPISRFYQNISYGPVNFVMSKTNYKFMFGTNTIKNNLFTGHPDLNISLLDSRFYKGVITLGCGSDINSKEMNLYTKHIYKKILNRNYVHSVRDERTKEVLENLGFKAINTGCPTLWGINKDLCLKIPRTKSNAVVFTLTCYDKKPEFDQLLINILNKNYKKVYFFPQGFDDLDYLYTFNNIDNVVVIDPSLNSFEKILKNNIDYIGTRLHAGIFSLKHGKRSIIISIDNRARDMEKDNKLICVERQDISKKLDKLINTRFATNIFVDYEKIKEWKSQFE